MREKRSLISDKIVHQEHMTITSMYAPYKRVSKYMKQLLTDQKGEVGNNTKIGGDFNIPSVSNG